VTRIAIYMEGGGETADGKARLRKGTSDFLRNAIDRNLKVVPCGSRNDAFDAFANATKASPDTVSMLLVDSEGAVIDPSAPRDHLRRRDGWALDMVNEESVHLMIQTMEARIICDTKALAMFYGQGFLSNALPRTQNVESVAKADIAKALEHATAKTTKGEYHKIRHASALLAKIDPAQVRKRCSSCDRLLNVLAAAIAG